MAFFLQDVQHCGCREVKKARVKMAARAASSSMFAFGATLLLPWMAKLLASLISFVSIAAKSSPIQLFCSLYRRSTKGLFASSISAGDKVDAVKPEATRASHPQLPWMTRVFLFLVSLLTDGVRRSDGTVRRFLCRLEVTVGADARARRGVRTVDVHVDPCRGLWFRLFLPACQHSHTARKLPVVVYFHGGGFAFLSAASTIFDAFCRRICREVGVAVVSVDYRLTPEHRFPAAYDDGIDVLRFLDSQDRRTNSVGIGRGDDPSAGDLLRLFFETADLSSCFLAGDSAGGNIAHHVAQRWTGRQAMPRHGGRLRLAGIVAIQPFFGGEGRVESETRLAGAPLVNTERTDWLWRAFLPEGADRNHPASNPVAAAAGVGEEFPPAMVVVGGHDPLQDWQRKYVESLRERGKEATLVEYAGAVHGFPLIPGLGASAAAPLMEDMGKFVGKLISPAAAVVPSARTQKRRDHCVSEAF